MFFFLEENGVFQHLNVRWDFKAETAWSFLVNVFHIKWEHIWEKNI